MRQKLVQIIDKLGEASARVIFLIIYLKKLFNNQGLKISIYRHKA